MWTLSLPRTEPSLQTSSLCEQAGNKRCSESPKTLMMKRNLCSENSIRTYPRWLWLRVNTQGDAARAELSLVQYPPCKKDKFQHLKRARSELAHSISAVPCRLRRWLVAKPFLKEVDPVRIREARKSQKTPHFSGIVLFLVHSEQLSPWPSPSRRLSYIFQLLFYLAYCSPKTWWQEGA